MRRETCAARVSGRRRHAAAEGEGRQERTRERTTNGFRYCYTGGLFDFSFFFPFPSCAFPSARPWLTGADDFRRGRHANTTPRARRVNAHRSDLTARRQQVRRRMPSPRDFSASRQREREREKRARSHRAPFFVSSPFFPYASALAGFSYRVVASAS